MQDFERNISDRLIAAQQESERLKLVLSFYQRLLRMGCDDDTARKILIMQAGWVNGKFVSKHFTFEEQNEITLWAKHLPA